MFESYIPTLSESNIASFPSCVGTDCYFFHWAPDEIVGLYSGAILHEKYIS